MTLLRSCASLLTPILLLCDFAADSWAQNYPSRVVRLLVPFSAGSGVDTIGRIVAVGLGDAFGQQVIVDNRAGAAGNIGADAAAKAAPDGYTVLLVNSGLAANVTLYRNLPYDLVRDLAPVTQLASGPAIVVVHPSLPVKSISELVKLAKAKPGAINYASGGAGTPTFIAAELFKGQAGIDLMHVPYRSGAEALTSIIAGETSVYFAPLASALSQIRQGRLRPLAVTSVKRMPTMPEYPTVAESGHPDYESVGWYGLAVPVKTPKETIAAIRGAAVSVLSTPSVIKRFNELGYVLIGSQPEEFAALIKSEIERQGKLLRALRVTIN